MGRKDFARGKGLDKSSSGNSTMNPGRMMHGEDWSGRDSWQAGRFSCRLLPLPQHSLLMEMWEFNSRASPCDKIPGKLQEESADLGMYRDNCYRRKETFS